MKFTLLTLEFILDNFDPVDTEAIIELIVTMPIQCSSAATIPEELLLNTFIALQKYTKTRAQRTQFIRAWLDIARAFILQSGIDVTSTSGISIRTHEFLNSKDRLAATDEYTIFSKVLNCYLHHMTHRHYRHKHLKKFVSLGLTLQNVDIQDVFKVAFIMLELAENTTGLVLWLLDKEGTEQLQKQVADMVFTVNSAVITHAFADLMEFLATTINSRKLMKTYRGYALDLLRLIRQAAECMNDPNDTGTREALQIIVENEYFHTLNQHVHEIYDLDRRQDLHWLMTFCAATETLVQTAHEPFGSVSEPYARIKLLRALAAVFFNIGPNLIERIKVVLMSYQQYCLRLQMTASLDLEIDCEMIKRLLSHYRIIISKEGLEVVWQQLLYMIKHRALIATMLNDRTRYLGYLLQYVLLASLDADQLTFPLPLGLKEFYGHCKHAYSACEELEHDRNNLKPPSSLLIESAVKKLIPILGVTAVHAVIALCEYHRLTCLPVSELRRLELINNIVMPELSIETIAHIFNLNNGISYFCHFSIPLLSQQYEIVAKLIPTYGEAQVEAISGINCKELIKQLLNIGHHKLVSLFRQSFYEFRDLYELREFIRIIKHSDVLFNNDEIFRKFIRERLEGIMKELLYSLSYFYNKEKPIGYTIAYLSLRQIVIQIHSLINPSEWINTVLLNKTAQETWSAYFIVATLCKEAITQLEVECTISTCLLNLDIIVSSFARCYNSTATFDAMANTEIMSTLYTILCLLEELKPNVTSMTSELISLYSSRCVVERDDKGKEKLCGIKLSKEAVLPLATIKNALTPIEQEDIYKNVIVQFKDQLQKSAKQDCLGGRDKGDGAQPELCLKESRATEISSTESSAFTVFKPVMIAPHLKRPAAPSLLVSASVQLFGVFQRVTDSLSHLDAESSSAIEPLERAASLVINKGEL